MQQRSPYAGIVTRGLAFACDAVLLNLMFAALVGFATLVLSVFDATPDDLEAWVVLSSGVAWVTLAAIYFSAFWVLASQTPGMRLMEVMLMRTDGEPIGWGRALRRLVGMVLAALPLFAGYALILVDSRRRGLHDRIAGTVVLYRPREVPTAGSAVDSGVPGR
jgi:uncharacterized RDD family membrane protein YckC